MSSIHPCSDWRDAVPLNPSQSLYLKPLATISISVQLPTDLLKSAGKSVSTVELMEKIKTSARPDEILGMKVLKSTLQYVLFEAQLENRHQISGILQRLDRSTLMLNDFPEPLKIRTCKSKLSYPSRHDWDNFFHASNNMNELNAGERPDTVHISMLPCHWFMIPQSNGVDIKSSKVKPSESMLKTLFEVFGPLRTVDIPMLDPYRSQMISTSSNTFTFGQDGLFEAYIQYQDYVGFVKCMTAFRGMKLLYREGNTAWTALVQVDFDRTRHQSDRSIKLRKVAREKLIQEEIDRERAEKIRRELDDSKNEERRQLMENRDREEKKNIHRKNAEEETLVAMEEQKLILVQRRLESLRLLDAILERVKSSIEEKEKRKKDPSKRKEKSKKDKEIRRQLKLEEKERTLRAKLLKKYQQLSQQRLEEQREKVRQMLYASSLKLRSAVNIVAEPKPIAIMNTIQSTVQTVQPAHEQEVQRATNGENRAESYGSRPKPMGYRPNYQQSHDRRNGGHSDHQQHRYSSFNRKRYPPDNFHTPSIQDPGRSDWKRSRFEGGKPNWMAQLDQELWDGPNVNFHSHSSRGMYRRGGRGNGDYHQHRTRDYPQTKDRYANNNRSDVRHMPVASNQRSAEP